MKRHLIAKLDKIKDSGLFRNPAVLESSPEREITVSGGKYLNLSSNNYLGLACHPEVKKAACGAVEKYGCGGTSSRLVAGTLELHRELERKLAALKKKESCLVFPSGFQANVGIMPALIGEGGCIIMDRLNHASIWDAAKLSGARVFVYPHRDMDGLEKVLKRASGYAKKLIITDSVFSMDGDLAPLDEIAALAMRYNAWTMIDEAHATGVFGKTGAGLAEHFGVEDKIDIIMGTLSKALGSQGGFVCGSAELTDYLINRSRPFIYTTAIAPACAAAALKALETAEIEPWRREKLLKLSRYTADRLKSALYNTLGSLSQIIPAVTETVQKTVELSDKLKKSGIFAPAIRPPTVPEGQCRLRFSLTSEHSEKDIDRLLEALGRCCV